MRALDRTGGVRSVRRTGRWVGGIVAMLALLEGARRVVGDARSARRSVGLDNHGADSGYRTSAAESTERSDADRCVVDSFSMQLAKPLPVPAMVWAVVPASGGRGSSTEAIDTSFGHAIGWTCGSRDLAQGLHAAKTWWAVWQPSNGAHWKDVAIRVRFR